MSYASFAQTYDQLMDKSLYDAWASYVQMHVPKGSHIFELACGTGDLASRLEKDYVYTASDLSEDMLVIAQNKLKKTQLLQLDMTEFVLDKPVDSIVCFADSLCYLADYDDLVKTFDNVYQSLHIGGQFLFDMHSIYQMEHVYAAYQFHYVDETCLFIWDSFPGEEPYSVVHEISCVNRLSNGLYERYDEVHFERTYPLERIVEALYHTGFSQVTVTADFSDKQVTEESKRWFFQVIK